MDSKTIMEVRTMIQEEIRDWVEQNARGLMPDIPFNDEEFDHVAMCMKHIFRWYYEGYPIGGFLTAIVRNDFSEACFHADEPNRKALYLYALFCANKIGYDYKEKALAS